MSKVFNVSVYLDINTVTCPGVWLCPKGKAFLKVCLFGVSDLTKEVDPFFPLVFKERFHFQRVFKNLNTVYELHDKVSRSIISLELLQCPTGSTGCVKLAIFNSHLSDILHPYATCFSKPLHTSGLELLFSTCKVFPGILAPKADISIKVMVTDSAQADQNATSKRSKSQRIYDNDRRRQQKVCHTKNNLNCRCFQYENKHGFQSQRSVMDSRSKMVTDRALEKPENSAVRFDRKETINNHKNVNNMRSDLNPANGSNAWNNNEPGRPITAPEEVSDDQDMGASRDDRGIPQYVQYNRDDRNDSPHRNQNDQQTDDGSTTSNTDKEYHSPVRNTSCEKLLVNNNYGMSREGDGKMRERYFKCLKERGSRPSAASKQRRTIEASKYVNNITGEPLFEKVRRKPQKDSVCRGCTCLRTIDRQMEKENIGGGRVSRYRSDDDMGHFDRLPIQKKFKNTARSSAQRNDEINRPVDGFVVEQEVHKERPPLIAQYNGDSLGDYGRERRMTSRSDENVEQERYFEKHGWQRYDEDQANLSYHDLQAGEMTNRSGYDEPTRHQGSRDMGDYEEHTYQRQPVLGQIPRSKNPQREISSSNQRVQRNPISDRTNVSNRYGRSAGQTDVHRQRPSDRADKHSRAEERYRDVKKTTAPAANIVQPSHGASNHLASERQHKANQNVRDHNQAVQNHVSSNKHRPNIPHASIDQQRTSTDVPHLTQKPTDTNDKVADSLSESLDDYSSDEACRCPLCKNYQQMYKPKIHPCPRFKKPTRVSSKVRNSKYAGSKKVISSRQSAANKHYLGPSRKHKHGSADNNECGLSNCEDVDFEFISNKKDIRNYYSKHT